MDKVTCELKEDEVTLPLFIKSKNGEDSVEFLIQWIEENKELLKQKILEYAWYVYSLAGGVADHTFCYSYIATRPNL